ncbi:MAG TPA: AzlD domain-containing protein [Ktedonobacterales bacterium]|nr:AzlD domain-containing protein [Ktedonobacterales bacterium]
MSLPLLLLIVLAGLATLSERGVFSVLPASWQLSPGMRGWLEDAPAAVFAALAAPGLLASTGAVVPVLSGSRVLSGIVGGYVAWSTRSLPLVLLLGTLVYVLDAWVSL